MEREKVSVFWFRRDLRIEDNCALYHALRGAYPVLPIFIFDSEITDELAPDDARISFIYRQLKSLNAYLGTQGSSLLCLQGQPLELWRDLFENYDIQAVFVNEDYEPYAQQRDQAVQHLVEHRGAIFRSYKDQVIFSKEEVLKNDGTPYTVFTPYKRKWLSLLAQNEMSSFPSESYSNYYHYDLELLSLSHWGFRPSAIGVEDYKLDVLPVYEEVRNFPAANKTSHLSPHLRFGTLSIRAIVGQSLDYPIFLSELVWREFFMQILFHFPYVVGANFRAKYNDIQWRNASDDFEAWKAGRTGYAMVDAGMRELNATGYMHNRVRMITAGFLCKHLLIDWRWGEAYFAEKLLDYDLSSNNGNWQWAAGTGCDAAPYFRIFNPAEQLRKFDADLCYCKRWVPELETSDYPEPIVDHRWARERAIRTYKEGLSHAHS